MQLALVRSESDQRAGKATGSCTEAEATIPLAPGIRRSSSRARLVAGAKLDQYETGVCADKCP